MEAALVCGGRLFHARAAATENVRSPRVERRVDGTSIVRESTERRQRRAATPGVGLGTTSIISYCSNGGDAAACKLTAGLVESYGNLLSSL